MLNYNALKCFIFICALLFLQSCTSTADAKAKSLIQTLEFGENEYGTFKATGKIKLGVLPFFSSELHIDYTKIKDSTAAEVVQ